MVTALNRLLLPRISQLIRVPPVKAGNTWKQLSPASSRLPCQRFHTKQRLKTSQADAGRLQQWAGTLLGFHSTPVFVPVTLRVPRTTWFGRFEVTILKSSLTRRFRLNMMRWSSPLPATNWSETSFSRCSTAQESKFPFSVSIIRSNETKPRSFFRSFTHAARAADASGMTTALPTRCLCSKSSYACLTALRGKRFAC